LIVSDIKKQRRVGVCHGPRCADYGGRVLVEALLSDGVACEQMDCQSLCPDAPIVRIDGAVVHRANIFKVLGRL